MTDRARELAEALSRSPWIDTHVADVCRRLLQKWIDEDKANAHGECADKEGK